MSARRKLTRAERLALGQIRPRACSIGAYDRRRHRLREIDAVAMNRHGYVLPVSVDARPYVQAVAFAANAMGASVEEAIKGWCGRFAPHLLSRIEDLATEIYAKLKGRRYDLNARDAAALLGVTFRERQRLKLKTIGACDLSPEDFKAALKEAKRKRDRERMAAKRQAKRPRNQSLMQTKPWLAEGLSRRTWYRRQKANGTEMSPRAHGGETTVSPHAQGDGTEMSRIRNLPSKATDLCHVPMEPTFDALWTTGGALRAAVTEEADDAV